MRAGCSEYYLTSVCGRLWLVDTCGAGGVSGFFFPVAIVSIKSRVRYLPLNSRFRDISRRFGRSLWPLWTPFAPYGHVTCASLSVTSVQFCRPVLKN
jgi:hypothetical protein